jgi:hypothetical protein
MVVVFLDTMIFLHARLVADIDWCQVLGVHAVRIVVPRVTIRELDKHKNSHPSGKVKKRAGDVVRWLGTMRVAAPTVLRDRVTLELQGRTPPFDFDAAQLDQTQADDQLIAAMLTVRATDATSRIVLVSQDVGPRMTAVDCGLDAVALDAAWMLPAEPDPLIKENERLRADLLALQAAQPVLRVQFAPVGGAPQRTHIEIPAPSTDHAPEAAWTAALAAESLAVPERHLGDVQPGMPEKRPHPGGVWPRITGTQAITPPTEAEYQRYAAERATYLTAFAEYQRAQWTHAQQCARLLDLALVLRNDGTAVADDVDIEVVVPAAVEVLLPTVVASLRETPHQPTRPVPPRPQRQGIFAGLDPIGLPHAAMHAPTWLFPQPDSWSLMPSPAPIARDVTPYRMDGETTVAAWHITRAKHGFEVSLPTVTIRWPANVPMMSLTLQVTIRAASLPKAVQHALHVRVIAAQLADESSEG